MYGSEKSSCGSEFWSNGDQSKEVTATSRRQLEICTLPFKSTNGSEIRGSGGVRTKARNPRAERHRLRGSALDLYCLSLF